MSLTLTNANGAPQSKAQKKRKRFRFFVNSDEQDNNVLFVEERGQLRPATEEERKKVTIS